MIKTLLFDADDVIINKPAQWSDYLINDYHIPEDLVIPFFHSEEFELARLGRADLKESLAPYLKQWKFKGTVEDFLSEWFEKENHVDQRMIGMIAKYRKRGVKCYVQSRQEKYRAEYIRTVMGFDKLFDGLFFSADLGALKPDAQFWQRLDEKIRPVKKGEALVWDNRPENVESAKKFGFCAELFTDYDSFERIMGNYLNN